MKNTLLSLLLLLATNMAFSQESTDVFNIARKGSVEQVKEILKTNPNAFKTVNKDGFSPLTLACYRSNNEVAKLLVETGCDINQKSSMGTPLMAAVVKGNNDIVQFLVVKNADVNLTDENGITALIYAVQFNNVEALKILLKQKADKKHIDKQGKTAFEYAVFAGKEEIINLLK